ncbi:MAG: adenylyltransferase/cytidyltransferase family protein [Clostridia bacterium]|jgi:nicotinamide-nucleotide adenylyltransferase|nr:adenylyltransferase/cytidyltransferase family protein [Clostridia bacterium]
MKIGVFLSRMQPLHIGHLGMIDKALSENDRVIILIGSANRENEIRNPLNIKLRKEILENALKEKYEKSLNEKITIKELPDWTSEEDLKSNEEWGKYLYYNIVSVTIEKSFTIYFSDDKAIIEDWFQDKEIRKRIEIKTFERTELFENVSSTKIREAFLNNNKEYIEKSVPKAVLEKFEEIKEIIDKTYKAKRRESL